jgi:hypothetical protein
MCNGILTIGWKDIDLIASFHHKFNSKNDIMG